MTPGTRNAAMTHLVSQLINRRVAPYGSEGPVEITSWPWASVEIVTGGGGRRG